MPPPTSRPDRAPSRPPLTSRIRASFEGKRKKSSDGSTTLDRTNGFITQDPEALRDAIDKAINSEAFQNAIAANLAKLIKPSIKDALDTLQPVVEAVYSHEMLLRQTNKSVENILEKMDSAVDGDRSQFPVSTDEWKGSAPPQPPTHPEAPVKLDVDEESDTPAVSGQIEHGHDDTQIEKKLSQLSSALAAYSGRITEVVDGIAGIHNALVPTKETVGLLREALEQSNTTILVMQAQLDQLQADIGNITDAIGSDLGNNVKSIHEKVAAQHISVLPSHTSKLDAIATDLATLKGQIDSKGRLDAISASLEALQEDVQSSTASSRRHFAVVTPQIVSILTSVEGHTGLLADLKAADKGPEVLEAVQRLNASHDSHAATMREIKERIPAPTSISHSETSLETLAADVAFLIENKKAGMISNDENSASLSAKIDDILTTLEAHRLADQSPEILAALQKSNEFHAAHAQDLESIKSLNNGNVELQLKLAAIITALDSHTMSHASHALALEGMKSLEAGGTSVEVQLDLEPQLATIINTLEHHTIALEELKHTGAIGSEVTPGSGTDASLGAQMGTIVEVLETHTSILNELRDDISAEILTNLNDVRDAQLSHQNALEELRDADVSDEILTALHSSHDSHADHAAILAEINSAVMASKASHEAHATTLDEIKTIAARSIDPVSLPETSSSEMVDLGPVLSTLYEQNSTLAAIRDATSSSNESHAAHTAALAKISDASSASTEAHASHAASLAEVKVIVNALMDSQDAHKADLGEIKEGITACKKFNALHAAGLGDLKSIHAANSSSVEKAPSADFAALETHLKTLSTSFEAQTTTLCEIKEATATPKVLEAIKASHELLIQNHSILTSHHSLLDTIKESRAHEEILANISSLKAIVEESKAGADAQGVAVKELHNSTNSSHSEITAALAGLALGGTGATSLTDDTASRELLDEVKAVRAVVQESIGTLGKICEITTKIEAQIDIDNTTITTSITALSDELKAEIDATGTEMTSSINALATEITEIESKRLNADNGRHVVEARQLRAKLSDIGGQIQRTSTQIQELKQGVHLNEKGLRQLKEHVAGTRLALDKGSRAELGHGKMTAQGLIASHHLQIEGATTELLHESKPASKEEATSQSGPVVENEATIEINKPTPKSQPILRLGALAHAIDATQHSEPIEAKVTGDSASPLLGHDLPRGIEERYKIEEPDINSKHVAAGETATQEGEPPTEGPPLNEVVAEPSSGMMTSHEPVNTTGEASNSPRLETSLVDEPKMPVSGDVFGSEEQPLFAGESTAPEHGAARLSSPPLDRDLSQEHEYEADHERSTPDESAASVVKPSMPAEETEPSLESPESGFGENPASSSANPAALLPLFEDSPSEREREEGRKSALVLDPEDEEENTQEQDRMI